MLDHVKTKEMFSEPVQWRYQRHGQTEPAPEKGQRTPSSRIPAGCSATLPEHPVADGTAYAEHQKRNDNPRIERPGRINAVRLAAMGEQALRRQECCQNGEDYRSHPLNTSEAATCSERAKAKTNPDNAPIDPMKLSIGAGPDMMVRRAARHDIAPVT